jgi:hypothetical protein
MNSGNGVFAGLILAAVACVFPAPSQATTIRSASGYGTGESISQCQTPVGNCEGFQLAPIQVNGIWYNGADFFFRTPDVDGNSNQKLLDIIDVGQVSSGGSFFLPLLNPSASFQFTDGFSSDTLATGLFGCGNSGAPFAVSSNTDNNGNPIPLSGLPCMGVTDSNLVTSTIESNGILFSFNGDISNLVLFTEDDNVGTGSAVATPEPGSLALLGAGALALWGGLKRRKPA